MNPDYDRLMQLKAPDHVQVELWSRTGTPIADITHLVRNYYAVEERNEAEQLQFSMDLDAFEDYMILKMGADPVSNFREGQTEIIVKENGVYKFGTQLQWAPIELNTDGSATISVTATGYLNFFNQRYPYPYTSPSVAYAQVEPVEIARDLIRRAQSAENGDYGIVLPEDGYYVTGKKRDRTYGEYTASVKLAIQRLTNLRDGHFDFKVAEHKRFMTYASIGSPRTDFKIIYNRKGNQSNFSRGTINRGASQLYNSTIGMGSGNGEETLTSNVVDQASANEFGLREEPYLFNDVINEATLRENTAGRLQRMKALVRMPQMVLSGADLPEVPLEVGDMIWAEFSGRRLLEDLNTSHRIERIETRRDENSFKSEVTIYHEEPEEESDD